MLTDLEKRFGDILELIPYREAELVDIRECTLDRWLAFDSELDELLKMLADNPGKSIILYYPVGEDRVLGFLRGADGSTYYDDMTGNTKLVAAQLDPDFFISSVKGAPEEQVRMANDLWLEETINRTPTYAGAIYFSAEVEVLWFEVGVELDYLQENFPDGRVQLTFSASGKLGAALGVGSLSAGGEAGFLLMHEFDTQGEAVRFLNDLREKVLRPLPDYLGAAVVLGRPSTLESSIVSVGVYGAGEFEIPMWLDAEAEASLRLGYARDLVSDENIVYFDAECRLEVEDLPATENIELDVGVSLEGEQRWRSNGDSYVDVHFAFRATAGKELEVIEKLFPDASLSAGGEVSVRAFLELDDPSSRAAWKNLLNPLDGSLDLGGFLDAASVTLQTSTVVESEVFELDLGPVEAEVGSEVRTTRRLWTKAPGQGYEEIEI